MTEKEIRFRIPHPNYRALARSLGIKLLFLSIAALFVIIGILGWSIHITSNDTRDTLKGVLPETTTHDPLQEQSK